MTGGRECVLAVRVFLFLFGVGAVTTSATLVFSLWVNNSHIVSHFELEVQLFSVLYCKGDYDYCRSWRGLVDIRSSAILLSVWLN